MTKKTMAILSVFMVVALTAVGFAAWLIVGNVDDETQGSFVSNELQDKYFKVEVDFDTTTDTDNGKIVFGAPTEENSTAGDWLTFDSEDAKQKLSAVATIKFTPEAGFDETKTMQYYLQDSVTDSSVTYRTIRVAIDIFDVTDVNPTDNYKWFDMAVQLGYLQYPTATWIDPATDSPQNKQLTWAKNAGVEQELGDADKFQNGFLYIDLTYDMFKVDANNQFATAQIEITFNWGNAVDASNPYTFLNAKDPEDTLSVVNYFDTATSTVLATTDENNTIRYKDLAESMLSYLRDHVNYDAQTTTGLQFSIKLTDGDKAVVNVD